MSGLATEDNVRQLPLRVGYPAATNEVGDRLLAMRSSFDHMYTEPTAQSVKKAQAKGEEKTSKVYITVMGNREKERKGSSKRGDEWPAVGVALSQSC